MDAPSLLSFALSNMTYQGWFVFLSSLLINQLEAGKYSVVIDTEADQGKILVNVFTFNS